MADDKGAVTVNEALMVDVLVQIERHPETWDQASYLPSNCGSGMCFAGWACALTGFKVDHNLAVGEVASELLGIDEWEQGRGYLFDEDNKLPDLYAKCADLMGIEESVLRDKVRCSL